MTVGLVNSPGVILHGSLTETAKSGVATFSSLSIDTAGTYTIQASSGSLAYGSTNPITVTPGSLSGLAISTEPPGTVTAGGPFGLVVDGVDQYGNLVSSFSGTVTVGLLNGHGVSLNGTVSEAAKGGIATFSGLSIDTAGTYTIQASSGSLTTATTGSIAVSPAPAGQLVVTQQPSTTAIAGGAFSTQPIVKEEDPYGNVITSDSTHTVTAARGNVGTASLQGSALTVTFVDGVATFGGLFYDKAETMDLGFSTNAGGVGSATSNDVVVVPAAPYKLAISTQPSPTATAGQPFATQPVVEILDQYGNIETGDDSTVITASLASGAGPLKGTVTATVFGGVATFTNLADPTAETMSLDFSGEGLTVGPSNDVNVIAGVASQLMIQTQPYSSVVAGNPLTDPIVIDELDAYGNIVKSDNSTVVTASLASGSGTLTGPTTATVVNGVASFNGLEDNKAGTLTLQFAAGSLPPVVSNPSTVVAAPASRVVSRPPGGVVAGISFGLEVDAYDPFGNLATSFNSPVTVSLASGSGTLTGTLTMSATAGVAQFTDLVDTTSGPISLNATSGTLTSGPPVSTTVSAAAPAQLSVHVQPSSTATAGQPFATQPVIYEEDQYGNLVTSDDSTVVTASLNSGAGTLLGTTTATVSGGVASFTGLSDDTAGTLTLGFSSTGLTSAVLTSVVVSPAAASQLAIQTQPSSPAVAGQAFTPPVIDVEDQYGNLETGDKSTVVAVSLATGTGPLLGTTTATASGGVATLPGLSDDLAEPITLKFSSGSLAAATSQSIVVNPAVASQLVIHTQPSSTAIAGQAFGGPPVIYELDAFNNLETGDNSTTITASLASGTGPLQATTSVTVKGGVATFSDLADDLVGSVKLDFSSAKLTVGPSNPIIINTAVASQLVISTEPSSTATAGQALGTQPVISEEDRYGNLVTSDNSTIVTVSLATGTKSLQGTTTATVSGGVATFQDLASDLAGTVALKFSSGSLTPATSQNIVVSSAAASQLVVTQQPTSTATAGQPFATQPIVTEEDRYGNIVTSDSTSQVVADTGGVGTSALQGDKLTVPLVKGVATFSGLSYDKAEAMDIGFSTNATGVSPAVSKDVTVNPAAASQLIIVQQPSSTATAGLPFANQPVVREEDAYGNLETADNSTPITANLGSGTGPLQGATTATVKGGVATFAGLADDRAEDLTLTFTASSLTSTPSHVIDVSAAAASQLVVTTPPPDSLNPGQTFTIAVSVEDPFGNVVSSYNGPVTISVPYDNGSTAPVQAVQGVATFPGITASTALQGQSIQAGASGLKSAIIPPINVNTSNSTPPIVGEHIVLTYLKHNKKGKAIGKPSVGIEFDFGAAINAATADNVGNYQLGSTSTKKVKKKVQTILHPIGVLSATTNASRTSVTLTTSATQKTFAKGGQITVIYEPGDTKFTISPKAAGITPSSS